MNVCSCGWGPLSASMDGGKMARPPRVVNSVLIRCWGPMQEKHQWSLSLGCWPLERLGKGVPSSCPGTEKRQEGREDPGAQQCWLYAEEAWK